jgi:hypothetical protein
MPVTHDEKGDRGWDEAVVRFPVNCPICARSQPTELRVGVIAEALILGSSIRLHAGCHNVRWDATQSEIEQMREYLSAVVHTLAREDKPKE